MATNDPFKKLRREFPTATDVELADIQMYRSAKENRAKFKQGPELDDLQNIRAQTTAKKILMNMLERGDFMKESNEKQKYSPEYLQGYYQAYMMTKEAKGGSWHQSLLKNWKGMSPQAQKWISALIGAGVFGGGGALMGRMIGGKGSGMTPLMALLGALLGGAGGYFGQDKKKRDIIGKMIGATGKGYDKLFGAADDGTPAPGPESGAQWKAYNKRMSGLKGATPAAQAAAEKQIEVMDENSPDYAEKKRKAMVGAGMLGDDSSKDFYDNAANMAATGVNPDDPMQNYY